MNNPPTKNERPLLIGRQKQINQILELLNSTNKSITLLTGESGIGKSQFLDKLYSILKEEEQLHASLFVGYYSEKEA